MSLGDNVDVEGAPMVAQSIYTIVQTIVGRKPEGVKVSTNCNHEVWVKDGKVYMANDDDGWYVQEFSSPSQIDAFIKVLESARDECFRQTPLAPDTATPSEAGESS